MRKKVSENKKFKKIKDIFDEILIYKNKMY